MHIKIERCLFTTLNHELKELREKCVKTFDVVDKSYFTIHIIVLYVINDFLVYGAVFGYIQHSTIYPISEDISSFHIWGKGLLQIGYLRYLCLILSGSTIASTMKQFKYVLPQESYQGVIFHVN